VKKTAAACPGTDLHVVCDNYATHKHPEVRAWLAKNPRIRLHSPRPAARGSTSRNASSPARPIRRGSFTSVKELTATIGAFIDNWNDHPRPFTWTEDADEILRTINRAKTNERPYRPLALIDTRLGTGH
jgi:hypothetical protein